MGDTNSVEFLFEKPKVEEGATIDRAALDAFGKLLMVWVRDYAISETDSIAAGTMRGATAAQFPEFPELFNDEQLDALHRLIPEIVDRTLHHLLWKLREAEWVDIAVHTEAGTVPSLREASVDDLEGVLYGWIPMYSKQRYDKTSYHE